MRQEWHELVLFHSNDIHSNLENASKIKTIIDIERKKLGRDAVIAVDVGDHMDRMRMETEGSNGQVHRDILEATSYDVITLGNNEGLTFTVDQLNKVYEPQTSFKVVCSNLTLLDDSMPSWLTTSTIIERAGVRIGFVGVTADFSLFYHLMSWKSSSPIASIKSEIRKIKENVDIIVLLSHLGIKLDEQIVDEFKDINILLGAHTHHLFNPPIYRNQTLMCAAGKLGEHLGRIQIRFNKATKEIKAEGEVLPTAAYTEDKSIRQIIKQHSIKATELLSQQVTVLAEPLEANDYTESPLPNLLATGLRHWCNADIGLVNSGQLLGGLASGQVTIGELHAICPSPINPCVMKIKGKHLRLALEQSLMHDYIQMPIRGYGFRGNKLGVLAVDGMNIIVYEKENKYLIKDIIINNTSLQDEQIYQIATIDMFSFCIGYKSLSEYEDIQFYLPEFIRDVLAKELKNKKHIAESRIKRWIYT